VKHAGGEAGSESRGGGGEGLNDSINTEEEKENYTREVGKSNRVITSVSETSLPSLENFRLMARPDGAIKRATLA